MMTLHFFLRFRSTYGQCFFIMGNIAELGNNEPTKAIPLDYLNDKFWHLPVDVPANTKNITYKYILRDEKGHETIEWADDRTIEPVKYKTLEAQITDLWNYPGAYENAFYTQPFLDTIMKPQDLHYNKVSYTDFTHLFKVKAPLLQPNEVICITGDRPELGAWDEVNPLLMERKGNWFCLSINLANTQFPVNYKYGVYNVVENKFVQYENGANRKLYGIGKRQINILHDGFIRLPNDTFKGTGIAIPVFSLRSNLSFGIGEFTDIKQLVDWTKSVGFKLIQLLPINDTTATHSWMDSYPYAPISVFALHPVYLNIAALAGTEYAPLVSEILAEQPILNELTEIDFEAVLKAKWKAIQLLYPAMKSAWLESEDYQTYHAENKHWLDSYAVFCYLRDQNETANFSQWKSHSNYDEAAISQIVQPGSESFDQIGIHLFTQYYLHLQLKDSVAYAHQQGIIMKGDLPIGIYRNSADAWVAPELYDMNAQAGAPPDDFAVKGQNWGFPTYNWKKMQEDGFLWWKKRFEQMSLYFDAFRIDHILGFFRIWSIPMNAVEGILGHFVPCLPVYQHEFAERGIWFDDDRYSLPFINESVLYEMFGEHTDYIKSQFLKHNGLGGFRLKTEFNTQRKVEQWFENNEGVAGWMKLKVFDLISNVILIPDTDKNGQRVFHFRIGMENTMSFRYLDENTKHLMKELYVDYFFRRQDDFWGIQAMQKLPALKAATRMLVCGEDLGMVPDCVPGVMKDTGLLSLEIQRMPKDSNRKFFHPSDAPYMSVVTPSTHDMSTIRGWWEENAENSNQFFHSELGQQGDAPFYCEPWINKAIISQHMYSPAMWAIFQLQDLLGCDGILRRENPHEERINIPANPKHYWRYRMHMNLQDLIEASSFNEELKALVINTQRN